MEKPAPISLGYCGTFIRRNPFQLRQPFTDMAHIPRVVPLPPVGDGGHVGAVRLYHDMVQGNGLGGLHRLTGVFVGEHPGEGNHPAQAHQVQHA